MLNPPSGVLEGDCVYEPKSVSQPHEVPDANDIDCMSDSSRRRQGPTLAVAKGFSNARVFGFRGGSGATLNLLKPSRGALDAVTLNGAL